MKNPLTDNGVLALYNPNSKVSAKVQVLYMTHWNPFSFLRVRDSKNLSPIMIIMKTTETFFVGDVILIKKVQLQPSSMFKDDEILTIIDSDLNHIVILEYQVIEKKDKFGLLLSIPTSMRIENSYWNSLSLIKNNLIKADSMAEAFFREGEKRLQLLRPDCNLLRERGNELFKKQNFCKAILHYDMAKQKDHYDARVWNNSSQAYFFNNEYEKARRDALVALKLDPFNRKAYYRAGRAMERAGDIKGALEIIEAGLYVCGKCVDMEKLLNLIKGKREESQNSNTSQSKRKISNGEVLENGTDGAGLSRNTKRNIKPKESPQKRMKDTAVKQEIKIDTFNDAMKPNKTPVNSLLVGAKMLYEKGKFKNALELFEVANNTWVNHNTTDIEVVRYLIDVCKVKLKVEAMKEIKNNFLSALSRDGFPYPPALHFWLANVYEILEDQDKVIHHANACLQLLENSSNSYCLYWPGVTKELIPETSPTELKKWFNEGTWRSAPLARCRYADCISIQNYSLAKTEIYTSDLDYRGYVEVECEEVCSICYHPGCWKAFKEQNDGRLVGKRTDKDILGLPCFTPDCTGKISSIRIYDETSQLRNEIIKDKKDKKSTSASKPKKKKDKKKSPYPAGKPEDRKKGKGNELVEPKVENDVEIIKEETKKLNSEKAPCSNGVDPINFDGNDFKVLLKKDEDADGEYLANGAAPKKSKNRKKKKGKAATAHISIEDDIEDRFVHNEYLSRLRALKAHRETLELDSTSQSSLDTSGLRYLPECVLDPERPFYLPQHLQENPAQLESILRAKMATTSSSDIDQESISTLLEFMYDWLKAHSPMLINDCRIKDYISENFPPNAVSYVNKCGGVCHFLLQSFRFALIDDIVCVNEQVLVAQQTAIQIVLDRFKTTKFLISDGHKALRLSHLVDDNKSTCSSNSSLLATVTSATSATSTESKLSQTKISLLHPSSTPYKNAALGKCLSKESENNYDCPIGKLKPESNNVQNIFSEKENSSRKPKLKTMDIDAFEVIQSAEIGQLFSVISTPDDKSIKSSTSIAKGELCFHSDEEMDNDVASLQQLSNKKLKSPNISELKEKNSFLESNLTKKTEECDTITEEKERLISQNQELNDRFSQIKMKSSVEISAWRKNTEDAQEEVKVAKSNFETYKSQKEGEIRKLLAEKSRFQEETKAWSLKVDSLQLTIDQLKGSKSQYEEEISQKSVQLAEQQMQMMKFQESSQVLDGRVRDAESKYLSMKRDLIKLSLEKTKKRLTAEVNKMRELLLDATDHTQPSKAMIAQSIAEWDEIITKINNSLHTIKEECVKLLEYIRLGRPLNSLPPGDLQIPSIPDLTVAHLLHLGRALLDTPKGPSSSKMSPGTPGMGLLGDLPHPYPGVAAPSQFASLASGRAFSLGQLGITPPLGSPQLEDGGGRPSAVDGGGSSLLGTPPRQHHLMHMGLGMGGHPPHPAMGDASAGFGLAGLPSALAGMRPDDRSTVGSSDSSPVPATPLSANSLAGTNDFSPTYSMVKKSASSDANQMFGQLPWNFAEDHLKSTPYGTHTLNIQTKEIKRPSKLIPPPSQPVLVPVVPDLPLIPPSSSSMSSLNHHPSCSQPSASTTKQIEVGGSAFGLQSLLEVGSRGAPRTIATPTTPTATKPKFQNLRSITNMGAIGTLPPKVVRPIPRPGTMPSGLQSMNKEDSMTNSAAYKRLIEGCKQKFGNEYQAPLIHKAIREVREQNKNSLSGLTLETILEQVETQLRLHKRAPAKAPIAPWAGLTQLEGGLHSSSSSSSSPSSSSQWQGPARGVNSSGGEEHCAICLEMLNSSTTKRLSCKHVFHIKCIKNWLALKSDCPICRKFDLNTDEYPSLSHG